MPSDVNLAVVVSELGLEDPAAAVAVRESPVPQPAKGEVLCRLLLRPINPSDVASCQGRYPGFRPANLPAVPGLEGLGQIEAHGEGAGKLAKGTRVVAIRPGWPASKGNGTWQQFVCVPEDTLVPVPDGVSDEAAAQFLTNPVSVVAMLDVLQIPRGEWLVQSAAGSVLGRQMIQIARHRGLKTLNIIRRPEQAQELLDLGADAVVCSATEDVIKRSKDLTGGNGAYAGIDSVAGETISQVIACTRRSGTVLNYGALSGVVCNARVADILFGGKTLTGFWLPRWLGAQSDERVQSTAEEVLDLMRQGILTPYSGQSYTLQEVKAALEHANRDARGGKVFLKG